MKIACPYFNALIEIHEGVPFALIIENQPLFRQFAEDIHSQLMGGEGDTVFSINNTPVAMSKYVDLLESFAPFDINSKTMLSGISAAIEKVAVDEKHYIDTSRLIAETEKYAHVTFFFNGGRETPYDNEERILVPSPKVATYDLKPEMSAYEVKDKLVAAINENKYDFIVVNYANGDMVGHTGIYEAIEKAVVAVDACVKDTIEAAKAQGYEAIIIADHGNADHALNEDGTPNTAHSLNPVPCVYVTENKDAKVADGRLADVAPTILKIMGLEAPAEMNGQVLIK